MAITLSGMISLLATTDPEKVYQELLESNDDFRGFIEETKNKSRSEMIAEYSLDNIIRETLSHAS